MRHLFIDFTPLRHSSAFRGLWLSSLLSSICSQIGVFAVTFQIFVITNDSIAVGAIGLFVAGPTILFAFLGGNLADVLDRRKLMLITSAAQFGVGAMLAAQAIAQLNSVWLIYTLVAIQSTIGAIGLPTRQAALRRLLPASLVPAGLALYLFSMHSGLIFGPALSGVIAAGAGIQFCFVLQIGGFLSAFLAALRVPPLPADPEASTRLSLRAIGESLQFIFKSRVLRGAFIADLSLTVLGLPVALLPALNAERFGGDSATLGLLTSAIGVGALAGTVFSGPLGHLKRKGVALMALVAVWAMVMLAFSFSYSLPFSLALLALSGAADVLSLTLNQAVVQSVTPDNLRGRVSAAEHVVQMGGPQIGAFRGGLIGSIAGTTVGISSGAVATLAAIGAIAVFCTGLRDYRDNNAAGE